MNFGSRGVDGATFRHFDFVAISKRQAAAPMAGAPRAAAPAAAMTRRFIQSPHRASNVGGMARPMTSPPWDWWPAHFAGARTLSHGHDFPHIRNAGSPWSAGCSPL